MGKGPYSDVPVFPFPEKLINKIMDVVSIRERYGKSDIHRQFKVKFDKYPLGDGITNLYYGDRLRRI